MKDGKQFFILFQMKSACNYPLFLLHVDIIPHNWYFRENNSMNLSFYKNIFNLRAIFSFSFTFFFFIVQKILSKKTIPMLMMMTTSMMRNLGKIKITSASLTQRKFYCKMSIESFWEITAAGDTMQQVGAKKALQSFWTFFMSREMLAFLSIHKFH